MTQPPNEPPTDPSEEPLGGALAPQPEDLPEAAPSDLPPPPPPPPADSATYPPPPPPAGYQQAYPPAFPSAPGTGAMGLGVKPHRGGLVLGLGIASLVFSCGCLGTVLGIFAIVMGNKDLAQMDSGAMEPSGRSSTQTGRTLGIVGVAMSLVIITFALILVFTTDTPA
jgi:hypothetical protein